MMVMRLCLERISPPRKDHPFKFTLPEKTSSYDTADMISGMLRIVASGEVTPDEANWFSSTIKTYHKTLETSKFENRIIALEKGMTQWDYQNYLRH
jgi:hypothetical protein